jgi:hypothetical protein
MKSRRLNQSNCIWSPANQTQKLQDIESARTTRAVDPAAALPFEHDLGVLHGCFPGASLAAPSGKRQSAFPPIAAEERTMREVGVGPQAVLGAARGVPKSILFNAKVAMASR